MTAIAAHEDVTHSLTFSSGLGASSTLLAGLSFAWQASTEAPISTSLVGTKFIGSILILTVRAEVRISHDGLIVPYLRRRTCPDSDMLPTIFGEDLSHSHRHRVNLIAPWIYDTPIAAGAITLFEAVGAPVSDISLMVKAALRLSDDDGINGRAFAVGHQRMIDLCDDIEGQNAEKGILELRKNAPKWESKIVAMLGLMGYSKVF